MGQTLGSPSAILIMLSHMGEGIKVAKCNGQLATFARSRRGEEKSLPFPFLFPSLPFLLLMVPISLMVPLLGASSMPTLLALLLLYLPYL
jgi:hypothetical protein